MELDNRIQTLIAVGASVSANCQSCLRSTIAMALESGVTEQEIMEAIELGQRVRKGAASKMDKFALDRQLAISSSVAVADDGCECGQL